MEFKTFDEKFVDAANESIENNVECEIEWFEDKYGNKPLRVEPIYPEEKKGYEEIREEDIPWGNSHEQDGDG